uniref:Uncharacterized protein n=1 Tax=Timema cristinae TaxID=61476 RepID=A0A7R9CD47_TIMCR|nr:unnamed protein product [Timema cristinae]
MQSIPLPEDIGLKGISPLKTSHNGLDWDYFRDNSFKVKEEGLLRAFKLVEFGHYLASIPDTGMRYDSSTRQFVISEEPPTLSPEVPELEEKGKRTSKPTNAVLYQRAVVPLSSFPVTRSVHPPGAPSDSHSTIIISRFTTYMSYLRPVTHPSVFSTMSFSLNVPVDHLLVIGLVF